jgi:hypothetical protein
MIKSEDELKKLVEDLHLKAKAGLKPEGIKTELKGSWYNMDKSQDVNDTRLNVSKFLNAVTALANTYGPTGYLVIGIDETNGVITDSPFVKSGLKDKSDLYGLIVRNVDKPIRYENYEIETEIDGTKKTITVIVIPPSLDKPHVIGVHYGRAGQETKNYIPVKKDTGTFPASRTDIDLMYYDNQNIVPEYAINLRTYKGSEIQIKPAGASVSVDIPVIFENFGRKPMVLVKCVFVITEIDGKELATELKLELGAYSQSDNTNIRSEIVKRPIIVPSNEVAAYICHFFSWKKIIYDDVKSGKFKGYFVVEDVFGNEYESLLFRPDTRS